MRTGPPSAGLRPGEDRLLADRFLAPPPLDQLGKALLEADLRLEAEIALLPKEEQAEFLASVGASEPGLNRLIFEAYKLLDLFTYFTAGEKEVRAWTIRRGTKAPGAAGVIHSDFEKGFIRAETYSSSDLFDLKTEAAVKEAGKYRLEGKDYVVKDGDVLLFKFNVAPLFTWKVLPTIAPESLPLIETTPLLIVKLPVKLLVPFMTRLPVLLTTTLFVPRRPLVLPKVRVEAESMSKVSELFEDMTNGTLINCGPLTSEMVDVLPEPLSKVRLPPEPAFKVNGTELWYWRLAMVLSPSKVTVAGPLIMLLGKITVTLAPPTPLSGPFGLNE